MATKVISISNVTTHWKNSWLQIHQLLIFRMYVAQKQRKIVLFVCLDDKRMEKPEVYIKNALKDKLPAYMLPNKYNVLDELPKNNNGKIERKKLKEQVEI